MTKIAISTLAVAAALAALAPMSAAAQDNARHGRPGGGWNDDRASITVYRDAWYQGQSTTYSGEIADLGRTPFNDQISSMRFQGRWEACTDAYFRGQCQTFSDSVGDLARVGMNDRISSLRPSGRGGNGGGWGGGNNGGGWGGGSQRDSITVFKDSDFSGRSMSFNDEVVDLRPLGFNDEISSIRLRGAWEVCEDSYFRGRCQIVQGDVRTLRDMGLNDRISSMRPARRGGGR